MITLEKIDQIVERTGVSYKEAKSALEASNFDVVDAIIYIEQNTTTFSDKISDGFGTKKDEVFSTLKELINKGNVTKVILQKEGKKYLDIPLNIAAASSLGISVVIGSLMIPIIAILGTGLYMGNFRIKIVKDDGSEVDVNEETEKKILLLKGKVEKSKEETTDIDNKDDKDKDEFVNL